MNRTLRTLLKTSACAVLVAGIFTGCMSPPADLQPGTAEKLQERLRSLAQSAAQENFPAATSELELLAADVSTAAANGDVSAQRQQEIQTAIDLIRADLEAMTPSPADIPNPETPQPAGPQPPEDLPQPLPETAPVPVHQQPAAPQLPAVTHDQDDDDDYDDD